MRLPCGNSGISPCGQQRRPFLRPNPGTEREDIAIAAAAKSVDSRVSALIGAVAASAAAGIAFALPTIAHTVSVDPRRVAAMLALTLVLQLFSVPVYGRGGFGVSAIGILATAFLLVSQRVWPGILGILAGAALALAPFARWFVREAASGSPWR